MLDENFLAPFVLLCGLSVVSCLHPAFLWASHFQNICIYRMYIPRFLYVFFFVFQRVLSGLLPTPVRFVPSAVIERRNEIVLITFLFCPGFICSVFFVQLSFFFFGYILTSLSSDLLQISQKERKKTEWMMVLTRSLVL